MSPVARSGCEWENALLTVFSWREFATSGGRTTTCSPQQFRISRIGAFQVAAEGNSISPVRTRQFGSGDSCPGGSPCVTKSILVNVQNGRLLTRTVRSPCRACSEKTCVGALRECISNTRMSKSRGARSWLWSACGAKRHAAKTEMQRYNVAPALTAR